jgi:hypothetical protein
VLVLSAAVLVLDMSDLRFHDCVQAGTPAVASQLGWVGGTGFLGLRPRLLHGMASRFNPHAMPAAQSQRDVMCERADRGINLVGPRSERLPM